MNAQERKARFEKARAAEAHARKLEAQIRREEALRALTNAHLDFTVNSTLLDYANAVGEHMLGYWNNREVYLHAAKMCFDMVGEKPNHGNTSLYLFAWKRIAQLQRMSRMS